MKFNKKTEWIFSVLAYMLIWRIEIQYRYLIYRNIRANLLSIITYDTCS